MHMRHNILKEFAIDGELENRLRITRRFKYKQVAGAMLNVFQFIHIHITRHDPSKQEYNYSSKTMVRPFRNHIQGFLNAEIRQIITKSDWGCFARFKSNILSPMNAAIHEMNESLEKHF